VCAGPRAENPNIALMINTFCSEKKEKPNCELCLQSNPSEKPQMKPFVAVIATKTISENTWLLTDYGKGENELLKKEREDKRQDDEEKAKVWKEMHPTNKHRFCKVCRVFFSKKRFISHVNSCKEAK
jgi:hypothetical protein